MPPRTEKDKMLAGDPFSAIDPELVRDRARAKELLKKINSQVYVAGKELSLLIKDLLPACSADVYIEPPFHCDYGFNISCGKRVYFNVNCVLLDVCSITIGSHVLFGPGVHIYTATHPLSAAERRRTESGKPVTIGDDCWIGGASIILPGVNIGNKCVIGAGSVVTRDIPANSLAVGNPAKVIRRLD